MHAMPSTSASVLKPKLAEIADEILPLAGPSPDPLLRVALSIARPFLPQCADTSNKTVAAAESPSEDTCHVAVVLLIRRIITRCARYLRLHALRKLFHLLLIQLRLLAGVAEQQLDISGYGAKAEQLATTVQRALGSNCSRTFSGIIVTHFERKRWVDDQLVIAAHLYAGIDR